MKQTFNIKEIKKNTKKEPFPHQQNAFKNLTNLFTFEKNGNSKSGILVLPTGAGKTFTAVNWICRNVLPKNIKVLWLAHTGHLLDQAYETFEDNISETTGRETINIRVVASDAKYSKASDINTADDILIITTQTAISNWNSRALDGQGQQRKTAFEEFIKHSGDTGLFLVLDEAHHAPAYGCRTLLIGAKDKKGIKHIVPNLYLLGLTATPTYNDERRRGWLFEIFNTKIFKKKGIIYEADKADLIKQDILALPDYIQKKTEEEIEVDDKTYKHLVREHKDVPEHIIEQLASNSRRNDCIVKEYVENIKKYGKTIIFADRWFQCVYLKEKLSKYNINVDAVYTHTNACQSSIKEEDKRTPAKNSEILEKFKDNKIDVLLNVKILTEGTDVPSVNTVFITRQTMSSILMTQMIGRALRGKKAGGGIDKEKANIVFFTDNWKKIINFVSPSSEGGTDDTLPKLIKGFYPIEYISIRLVEELSRKIDGGINISPGDYLEQIPIGWYETEVLVNVDEETNKFTEFVIVYEDTKEKFEEFIKDIPDKLSSEWEKEKLDDEWMEKHAQEWIKIYFDKEKDDRSNTLDLDLIKIARHIAQEKMHIPPKFYTFEERDKHDLTKIAIELIYENEFLIQEKLHSIYDDPSYLWNTFYDSYLRFKTAFDSEKNRVYYIIKFGYGQITEKIIKKLQRENINAEKLKDLQNKKFTIRNLIEELRKRGFSDNHINVILNIVIKFGNPPKPPAGDTGSNDDNGPGGVDEEIRIQVFKRDNYTCLCCGKTKKKGKRLQLEVDHIIPRKFGGKDTVDNLQTLCLLCNRKKGINEVNFRKIHTPLLQQKELETFILSQSEEPENNLRRIINMFYHCQAVSTVNIGLDRRSKYYETWEISLYEKNNPEWLIRYKDNLLDFIHKDLNCKFVKDIKIMSPGFTSADEWNKKGLDFINQGKYEDAIKCFNKVLDSDSRNVKAWNNKGIVLTKLDKNEEALKCYDRSLEIDPDYFNTWYNKAIMLKNLGKNKEAIKCYDKALDIDPSHELAKKGRKEALKLSSKVK